MPVYDWQGVDLKGIQHTGVLSSSCYEELKTLLEKRSIGLIYARSMRPPTLTYAAQQELLSGLASLVGASIPLHTALTLISTMSSTRTTASALQRTVKSVADSVAEGMTLSEALATWQCADPLTLAVVKAGEKTGDIGAALEHLIKHRARMDLFKRKVRTALRVPLCTLFFFIICVLGIFVGVIPRFELYYLSSVNQLPTSTLYLFYISRFLRSLSALYTVAAASVGSMVLVWYSRSVQGGRVKNALVRKMLVGRSLVLSTYTAQLLQGLSFLLVRAVPLVQALEVCIAVDSSYVVREELRNVMRDVERGKPLSEALTASIFSSDELHAFIVLGESTGQLSRMVSHAGELFQQRVYSKLEWYIACINPLLLTCMGLLIAGLICAVYMPMLTLSLSMD